MDFNLVGTVILVLLSLGLVSMAIMRSSFHAEDKTLDSIIESASKGQPDRIFLTPKGDLDMCEYLGWARTCELEYGVVEFCELYKDKTYEIRAIPNNPGVCLNITEVDS